MMPKYFIIVQLQFWRRLGLRNFYFVTNKIFFELDSIYRRLLLQQKDFIGEENKSFSVQVFFRTGAEQ